MKRTSKLRKLSLKTETIRVLSTQELAQVVGGVAQDSKGGTCTCPINGCGAAPPTDLC